MLDSQPRHLARPVRSLLTSMLLLATTLGTAMAQATIDVGAPSNALTTTQTTATFPVTITRSSSTAVLGFSVTFTLAGSLTLPAGNASISLGPFLAADGANTNLQVQNVGGGQYVADGITLGSPCGSTALTGTLFNVAVASSAPGSTGTITINSVILRDCSNATLASVIGSAGSVTVDNTLPVVSLTSPNGGEVWVAGSSHDILYSATDAEGFGPAAVDLEWSGNSGASWSPVASGIANTGSFSWTVPATSTLTALVRVTVRDLNSNTANDQSNVVFTIQGTTTTTLNSTPNPSVTGESVALTATVAPSAATGSVEFFDGLTSLGLGTLAGGSASINTTSLAPGAHSLIAVYAGDAGYTGSTSAVHAHTVNQAATTTTATSSPNPSLVGESVALTASVAVTPPGAGTATGSVEFFDGVTSLGLATLSAGSAVLNTSSLSVGGHSITAVYAGSANFTGSTSAVHAHTVSVASSATTLGGAPNPSVTGESVALTATVAPAAATGSVEFFDGLTSLGLATLSGGSAVLNTSSLAPGAHSLTAVYAGDASYTGSTSAVHAHTVNQAATTTTATSSPNPSLVGESVALTASVAVTSPGAGTATGSVEFFDGVTSLGLATLSAGSAVLNTSSLTVGAHSITAVYAGSANFTGSTSAVHAYTVNQAATTTTAASSPNPSAFGESVALTASVSVDPPGSGTATGSVEFFDGVTSLGLATLSAGSAVLNTSSLSVGGHSITAVYAGNACYTGSTSAVHAHTVNQGATSTLLSSTPNPSTFGASVALTASVTVTPPGAGAATGSVEFFDGVTSLGAPQPLVAGTAVVNTSALTAGSHSLTAVYSGDASFSGSTSNTVIQNVNAAGTSASLVVAPDPGVFLDPETLTAAVAPATATGSVEFFDGVTSLGSNALSGGTAVRVTSTLSVGVHSLTAQYPGDANHGPATSAAVLREVKAKIVASAGPNGSITASGTVLVSLNATPSFTFAADPGYHVASVTVDAGAVALTSPYTFAAVSSNHTIDVQFAVNPPVAAISTLASTTLRTGNGTSGLMRIRVDWTAVPVGSTVQVWRAPYGNSPEYDDSPSSGSVPAIPSYPPVAPWSLSAVTTPAGEDFPSSRDFYYYVAFVTDGFGTVSPVSNRTAGSLSYALGDVSDGSTPGQGDNSVANEDVSLLGSVYGRVLTPGDAFNYLDVGPTTNLSVHARPTTDNLVNFEDLVMFGMNFGQVTIPAAAVLPVAAERDELRLDAPAQTAVGTEYKVRLIMQGTGSVHALSAALSWDPAVVEPVRQEAGEMLSRQNGVSFSPAPGQVDLVVMGAELPGLTGEGAVATLTFRVLRAGSPRLAITRLDARDASNRRVAVTASGPRPAVPVYVTGLAHAAPTPFRDRTRLVFTLASRGSVELAIFSVEGRRVRTIASGVHEPGEYRLDWDGRDDSGHSAAVGAYYARLTSAQGRFTRKVTFLR